MSNHRLDHCKVKFLESHNYKAVKPLCKGSFGEVLSAISPQKIQVAIKVITKENYREVEDAIWPRLNHPNLLPVLDVLSIHDMELRLFVSPRHPTALFNIVHGWEFLTDVRGLDRVRKWLQDTLSGLDYLHTVGLAHMDLKSDNVLITASDSAVICDFSGLSITKRKISSLCAPLQFRPPECWHAIGSGGVEGVPFDMWTYGLMALNVLTGHWPQMHMEDSPGWTWDGETRPVLVKALQEQSLYVLMRKAIPCVRFSRAEVFDALHFLLSLMRIVPGERPTAREAARHRFLLGSAVNLGSGDFHPPVQCGVPLESTRKSVDNDNNSCAAVQEPMACGDFVNRAFTQSESDSNCVENGSPRIFVNGILGSESRRQESIKKIIKGWFNKKFRRILQRKNNYVLLSNDSTA